MSEPTADNLAQSMEAHEHGTRFVDDEGRCLACAVAVLEAELDRLKGELNRQWEIEQSVILGRAAEERGDHEGAEIYADNLTQFLRQKAGDGGSQILCSSCAGVLRDDLVEAALAATEAKPDGQD